MVHDSIYGAKTPSVMDVAPCCYKGMDGMGLGWVSLGGVKYRLSYGAKRLCHKSNAATNLIPSL